jgi:hypothetical protein
VSGNPNGRPKGARNIATLEVKEFSRAFIADPAYQASLRRRILAGRAPTLEVTLWYYGHGKPVDRMEVTGSPRPLDMSKYTTEQLIQLRELIRIGRPATHDENGAAPTEETA